MSWEAAAMVGSSLIGGVLGSKGQESANAANLDRDWETWIY